MHPKKFSPLALNASFTLPSQTYARWLQEGRIMADSGQHTAITALDALCVSLQDYTPTPYTHWLKKIFQPATKPPHGLYLWGDVGRGKSMLMDLFFDHAPTPRKRRVHFHAFMKEVHENLFEWRKTHADNPKAKDPVPDLAHMIAQEYTLLCFDEMQVHDIADAMILGRLFSALFAQGVVVIFTSNRPPKDLYKDGLQRERFLPFISLLEHRLKVVEVASPVDYRRQKIADLRQTYVYPLGTNADAFMQKSFDYLTQGHKPSVEVLHVQGRSLPIKRSAAGVAWMDFSDLCDATLGASDYLQLATHFHTLLLDKIPQMSKDHRNSAKRFVTLIDVLYEHRVKLMCAAAVDPEQLYEAGDGTFEFARTVSRLIEMQSTHYLNQPWVNHV